MSTITASSTVERHLVLQQLDREADWIFCDFNKAQELEIGIRLGLSIFVAQNLGLYFCPQFYYYKDLAFDTSF